jgi:LPXTG-site transpeptidase (sortase) family protein
LDEYANSTGQYLDKGYDYKWFGTPVRIYQNFIQIGMTIIPKKGDYFILPEDLTQKEITTINNVIYNMSDKGNDVNKNIYLAHDDYNNLVIAAHSGSSLVSYFKNLDKLELSDEVIFIKNGIKRVYEIFKISLIDKNGTYRLPKFNYPVISLITCLKTLVILLIKR